jgi:hypothetical protein
MVGYLKELISKDKGNSPEANRARQFIDIVMNRSQNIETLSKQIKALPKIVNLIRQDLAARIVEFDRTGKGGSSEALKTKNLANELMQAYMVQNSLRSTRACNVREEI